jgi:hypothetical protein
VDLLSDMSAFDHEEPMRDTPGLLGIMGNPQHSETGPQLPADQRLDRRHRRRIEGRGRFIEQ